MEDNTGATEGIDKGGSSVASEEPIPTTRSVLAGLSEGSIPCLIWECRLECGFDCDWGFSFKFGRMRSSVDARIHLAPGYWS